LQAGIRTNIVRVGPNTQASYNGDTGGNTLATTSNYLLTEGGVDKTYGTYLEDQVDITDKLTLVGGLRFIYNTLRDKGSAVIPRGALIYKITDNWTAKYMYNSGDYLPSMNQGHRMPSTAVDGIFEADKSLRSSSNDFQIMYNDEKTTVSVDAFHMRLRQFLANDPNAITVNGQKIEAGYLNLGDISTDGIELDAHRKILSKLSIYGNYSYAKARMTNSSQWSAMINTWVDENGHMLDVPRHVYNLGIDWECLKNCNWNFHMRGWGWAKMASDSGNTSNTTFGWEPGRPYFDTTFLTESIFIFTKPVTFSVTCRNIFDSRGVTPMVAGNFDWLYEEGRTFDFRLTYKF
jgi:outer membrane receptor for ferrienterochelin and colicin